MAKEKLSTSILEDLKKRILIGEYKTNDKLPPERELAKYYNTSRVPIREAIQKLADEGIVKTLPGSGTIIISSGSTIYSDQKQIPFINDNHLLSETIRLRNLIEAEAAKEAALNRNTKDTKDIQNALFESINEIRKLKEGEPNSFFEADVKFHKSIAQASHSDFLIRCLETIPYTMATHQYWSLKYTTPRDEVVSYHTQIYESILDENADKAYRAMQTHLNRVEKLIMQENQESPLDFDDV